ncbi:LytR/AlgR family response regulator transcription factor [Flavihumibacter petaseus]|uniref:Putative two-component response regulator n=1 Tax=Flavihumibacter petaseus NBRC 106054 TaxID=1220578 RepID=A0A0E9MYA5_9BACT|nr:LytTR family DNA-binding domain-containing protein [Flavihumibacter petaseus]GAO42574.1 putative two-component response regulator [Flavihumibacter petaseus NBRC 106054]
MIKAIAIDDEGRCLETLSLLLQEYCPEVTLLATCRSAAQGFEALRQFQPELVFLDVEMPNMNGFRMLEQLGDFNFSVIFTTSYDQYAIRAIRYSALDYLLKPVDPRELESAVKKYYQQRPTVAAEQLRFLLEQVNGRNNPFTKLAVPTTDGFELIPANDIIRCEADDNYTYLFLRNNKKVVASRTLKDIEEQLKPFSCFLRVHHSFLVNLNEIVKYTRGEGGYLSMSDGSTVNVSRSRKESLLKWF